MQIRIPDNLAPVARAFFSAGVSAYAVGGLVRNSLLRLPPADMDVASPRTPAPVTDLFAGSNVRVVEKAAEFGTVELLGPDGLIVEHTAFRRESYPAGGAHRPETVTLGGTLISDAFRRDFTVNALYADLSTGEVTDPTGGLSDLAKGVLRTTSADPDDILRSDALRVLRLARFSGELGFVPEPDTLAAAVRHAPGLMDVAAERRREELIKILLCDRKYGRNASAVLSALELLATLGAWPALVPEMDAGRGTPQRPDHHRYDVQGHLFHACAAAPATLTLRLAALLHDIGKPACRAETGSMRLHDEYSERIARRVLTELRFPKAVVAEVCAIVLDHMYDVQNTGREETLRVRFARWGRERTLQMIAMREADIRGCGYNEAYENLRWRALYDRMLAEGAPFSQGELALTGKEIMAALDMGPGEKVGLLKERLLDHCARHPEDNTKERLLLRLKDYA